MPSSLLLEQDAITIRDEYDLLTEEEKPAAAAWLRDYTAQQEKSGQPLFPLEQAAQRERSQQIEKLYKNLEAVPSPISVGEPAEANRARALYANVQLLQTLYPDYKPEQHDFYKADYALRQFGSAEMDEHRFYTQVQGQFEKQERTDQAVKAAKNAAFRSAAQNQNLLKAFGEWQTATPDAPDEAKQTFFNTFNATEKNLAPHRELMVGVMDAMERTMTGKAVDSDDAFLQGAKELLLDVPDGDLPLVLASMRLDAEKRGLIQAEKKGTGYKHGAWQMLKGLQLVAPFGTVVENPEGELFWQQLGESIFRFGRGALKDRERMEKRIENVTEKGQIKFSGDAIRTVEDARKYVDEFMMEEFTSESMSSMDNPEGALVMRSLLDKRKTITLDAAATQLIQEAKARQMKGVRIEFEMDNLGDTADPVPNVFASTLGTSGTALALTVATRGMALPMLAVGYKNLEYSELSLKYPGMSREDKSQIAWFSGGLQALGDGIGGGALTKLPALKKLITQPLTNALIARAVGRVGLTYGVENLVEGGQDIATPALMLALKSDVPGYDWDHELKNFWAGRADVAMGMIPLTLLGAGGTTIRDIHGVQEMLSQNELLARAGTIEADRMIIVDLAQKGDVNGARAALQEAWARRDPAVAAEYQASMTEQQGRAQKAFEEATHLGLLPTVRKKDENYIVTDAAGNQAQFTSAQEAWQAAAESMTPEQHRLVNDLLQQRAGNGAASENRLQFSQSEGTQGQPAAQPPRTPGQAMLALAENENRFRRGPASESKELVGIVQEYELAQEVDFVDETSSIQDPHASKVEQIHLKNGGNAYLFHAKDGTVWMDRKEMRVSENDPVQGGDLVTQAFMTYAHNNGLRVRPDPLSVSDIAQQRDLSHMLSSALRHRTTGHLMPNGINLKTGEAFENMPGWREGDSREAFDHNVDLLARAEYEAVRSTMQTHGQTRLEDLRWDPQDDTVMNVVTGRRLSERDFKSIVSGLDSGNSGVGATTLSRALVARQALQSNGSGKPDLERTESADIQSSGGTVDGSGDKLFTLLQNKKLFYSQPDGSGATLGTTLGSSEQLGQTLAETARFLNQKQPGLVNEHTHLFTTVEALLASDYARQHPFTAEQIASLRTAEGFHDGKTGHSIVIAENTRLLPGENAQQALTRVVLHERVGHAGLQILLGSAESPRARRWAALSAQIPQAELDAIAGEAGYQKLAGDRSALAYEWFARRTEKDASLLEKDSLPRQMWDAFREMVMDLMAHVGLNPTLGRSFETQVNDLKIRARNAALRPVSEQTLGTTSYSQRADTDNLQPHGNSLARAWKAFTQFDDAFQYGRTSSADLHDIAQAVSEPGMTVTAHDYGSYIRLQGKNGFLDIREVKTATPYISSMDADSAGEVRGGGSQLYQAALDWIHNNGKKVRSDPSGLTWINDTRRTSNLMASALRWGTTQHLSVHPDQGVPWAEGNHEANLTAMAKVEMANAFKAVAQARDWRYDFAHERFIDATGRELTRDDFDQAVVLGDPGTSGVGLSTLRRAVLTASAIEKSERGELEGIIHDSEVRGKKWGGLDRITYSLPGQGQGAGQAQANDAGMPPLFPKGSLLGENQKIVEAFGGENTQIPGAKNVDPIAMDGIKDSVENLSKHFEANSQDVIIASNPYGLKPEAWLKDASSILRPGGRIIISGTKGNKYIKIPNEDYLRSIGLKVVANKVSLVEDLKSYKFRQTDGRKLDPKDIGTTILEKIQP